MRVPLAFLAIAVLAVVGCGSDAVPPGPFEQAEERVWQAVNRSQPGDDGIFVQATFRTFAYELASIYAATEKAGLGQEQVESRLRELIHGFIDGRYPVEDGTDINNLYFQYLIYVNPDFDPSNPIEKSQFDAWRSEYVRRLLGIVYDRKFPLLRSSYDERWGRTLFSRLVFTVYLNGEEAETTPRIDDIGARTFLVDEAGKRYAPSGTAGPYPYDFDRPRTDHLHETAVYRLYFPNRRSDRRTPILTSASRQVSLEIENLGRVASRRLTWDLPLDYPEVASRRLIAPADAETQVP